jgi:multidrug efflux pump subunit AcrB
MQIVGRDQAPTAPSPCASRNRSKKFPARWTCACSSRTDLPQFNITVDRDKAAELGLTEQNVANSVLLELERQQPGAAGLLAQPRVRRAISHQRPRAGIRDGFRADAQFHADQRRPARHGRRQILANLATMTRVNVPPVFSHYNVAPVIDVYGNVDGRDLGGVLNDIQPLVEKKKDLPRGSSIVVRGQAETMRSSFFGLGVGLVMPSC